jgi:hypothetical protein
MPIRDTIGLPFTLFRARDALGYADGGVMHEAANAGDQAPVSAAIEAATEQGVLEGSTVRLLFARPGMSLSYAWFKPGFPLPRHSHSADCLYFIIAGSLRIGTEELGAGDGFFVGVDVPYAYVPGEQGVEVLEFRNSDSFDIKLLANNPAWWEGALKRLSEHRPGWSADDVPPSGIRFGEA